MAIIASSSAQQPPVKVNVINVCTPSADEQKELSSALAKVPGKLAFASDYEVARGHSTLDRSTAIPGMQPLPAGGAPGPEWGGFPPRVPHAPPPSTCQDLLC